MKFLLISDIHDRATPPAGRIDNYIKTQYNKWKFIVDVAKEEGIKYILQAGDWWNNPNPPLFLINERYTLLNNAGIKVITILGQHDMYMRTTNLSNIASGLMQTLGVAEVLNSKKDYINIGKEVVVYGAGFGEKVPNIYDSIDINILLVHDMIGDRSLFPGHKLKNPINYLKKHDGYDLILCGDYHYPFYGVVYDPNYRIIVNTGCMMRMRRTKEDMEHKPHFYIYDTKDKSMDKVYIPIEKASKVFTNTKGEFADDSRYDEMIEALKSKSSIAHSFKRNLDVYIKENNVSSRVVKIIEENLK